MLIKNGGIYRNISDKAFPAYKSKGYEKVEPVESTAPESKAESEQPVKSKGK